MENRLMLLSSCAIYGKKNQLLLKIENSTILMINLKLNKIINNFFIGWRQIYSRIAFNTARI